MGLDRPRVQHPHARHDEGGAHAAAGEAVTDLKGLPLYQHLVQHIFRRRTQGALTRCGHYCGIDDPLLLYCHTAGGAGCQQQY